MAALMDRTCESAGPKLYAVLNAPDVKKPAQGARDQKPILPVTGNGFARRSDAR